MCHDGTGLRGERAEGRFWGVRTENGPPQTAQEPRSGRPRTEATLENRPIRAVIAVRSWSPDDAQSHAPLRVEKRLRPVVPLGRNRVGPLPRNRVVPFRRNQVDPFTRNPAPARVYCSRVSVALKFGSQV